MIDIENIRRIFALISTEKPEESDPERAALCEELCASATESIATMLKPGADIAPHENALAHAGAYLAFYTLLTLDEALMPDSISSGEVKLQMGEKSKKAERLYLEKLKEAAPALKSGFFFGSVTA